MKILIPILALGKSGGIKVLTNLANNWNKMGIETTILVMNHTVEPYYKINCDVYYLNNNGEKSRLSTNERIPVYRQIKSLYIYLKENSYKYDYVIANYNLTAYPIFLGSSSKNIYYIQAYEPEFYNDIKNNMIKKYIFMFLAWFSYFLPLLKIVNSNMYLNYKNIKTNYVVFPGIDLNIYFPEERNLKSNTDKFIIGCIGRNEEWKGSNDVSKAIEILHNNGYKNIELLVAFNPVNYQNHTLVFPDGDKNLADYYRSLDILITPGQIQLDAIHYPVIEAMATKTPLITTGYYPSTEKNCYLVPIKSPEKIAEKILYIINNYEKAIEKTNKAYSCIEEFSWKEISSKFIKILGKNK